MNELSKLNICDHNPKVIVRINTKLREAVMALITNYLIENNYVTIEQLTEYYDKGDTDNKFLQISNSFVNKFLDLLTKKQAGQDIPPVLGITVDDTFFDINGDGEIQINDHIAATTFSSYALGFIIDYAKKHYGKTYISDSQIETFINNYVRTHIIEFKGEKGDKGDDGRGISNIVKIGSTTTDGRVIDTYNINYSDGSQSTTFTVTNGKDGRDGSGEGGTTVTITEADILNMGFTKNKGTVTSVRVNETSYNPDNNGLIDLGNIGGSSPSPVIDGLRVVTDDNLDIYTITVKKYLRKLYKDYNFIGRTTNSDHFVNPDLLVITNPYYSNTPNINNLVIEKISELTWNGSRSTLSNNYVVNKMMVLHQSFLNANSLANYPYTNKTNSTPLLIKKAKLESIATPGMITGSYVIPRTQINARLGDDLDCYVNGDASISPFTKTTTVYIETASSGSKTTELLFVTKKDEFDVITKIDEKVVYDIDIELNIEAIKQKHGNSPMLLICKKPITMEWLETDVSKLILNSIESVKLEKIFNVYDDSFANNNTAILIK